MRSLFVSFSNKKTQNNPIIPFFRQEFCERMKTSVEMFRLFIMLAFLQLARFDLAKFAAVHHLTEAEMEKQSAVFFPSA